MGAHEIELTVPEKIRKGADYLEQPGVTWLKSDYWAYDEDLVPDLSCVCGMGAIYASQGFRDGDDFRPFDLPYKFQKMVTGFNAYEAKCKRDVVRYMRKLAKQIENGEVEV